MSELIHIRPEDIEQESFRIIGQELSDRGIALDKDLESVIKRVIHTTADFSYVDTLKFTPGVIEHAVSLIAGGATIITDTNMALAGINKRVEKYGCALRCYMADSAVGQEAKLRGVTRATVSMEKAMDLPGQKIIVVGNAPTALIELHRIMEESGRRPELIIGVPVGFVNVEYSKELFIDSGVDYIINFGRKGGSNVAAAIVNALSLMVETI